MIILIVSTAIILIAIGAGGVMSRRNPLIVLMCIELMLNAANLILVVSDRVQTTIQAYDGQLFVLMLLVVAAAEVGVGLAMIVTIFADDPVADIDEYSSLKG